MAIRVPIISEFQDQGIKSATAAFSKFKADIAKADGAVNKFKAGTSAAFGALQANAVAFGVTAGAALATFAAKAVLSYKDLGLAVGKFADATGVTTEQASRLIEVTSDLNIQSSSLETALNKLNRAAAEGASGFKAIGAEIVRTSTGAVDVNQTFLNVIDGLNRIPDPAQRAKVATELLGKGWRDLAVVIGGGADKLRKSLESVSGAKIYSPEQVAQTRRFQDAIKNLQDVGEDFAQSVGRALVPAVIEAVEAITDMLNAVKDVQDFEIFGVRVGDMATFLARFTANGFNAVQTLKSYKAEAADANQVTEQMTATWRDGTRAMIDARNPTNQLATSLENLETELTQVKDAWDEFTGALNIDREFLQISQNIQEFNTKWIQAMSEGKVNASEFQQDLIDAKLELAGLAQQVGLTKNAVTNSVMRIAVDTRPLHEALALIQMIRSLTLGFSTTNTGTYAITPYGAMTYNIPAMASGGIVSGPTLAMIGEAGPEAVIPLDRLAAMREAGAPTNITINVSGANPNDVVRALQQYVRQSGPVPVNTRAM